MDCASPSAKTADFRSNTHRCNIDMNFKLPVFRDGSVLGVSKRCVGIDPGFGKLVRRGCLEVGVKLAFGRH